MSVSVCVFVRIKERERIITGIMERRELNIQSGDNTDVGWEVLDSCTWKSGETITQDFSLKHCSG